MINFIAYLGYSSSALTGRGTTSLPLLPNLFVFIGTVGKKKHKKKKH